jgi:hypothetical protein
MRFKYRKWLKELSALKENSSLLEAVLAERKENR